MVRKVMSYGIYLPYIQNTMPRDTFRWMRHYIHFTDNSKCKNKPKDKSDKNYNPLSKIRFILEQLMKGMHSSWTAGKNVVINESMIK